jgi:hypothetical protein
VKCAGKNNRKVPALTAASIYARVRELLRLGSVPLPAATEDPGRNTLPLCSRRALTRHDPSGYRDARTQRPFHVAHKPIARVFPRKMKPPEPRVQDRPNGRHLSWGRKRVARLRPGVAGPVQASRSATHRIVRVKGFQGFLVSLSSVLRPAPPANGCAGPPEKAVNTAPPPC